MTTINCRMCNGYRETNGTHCLGCGTPVAMATKRPNKSSGDQLKCPSCKRASRREIEPGRYECKHCLSQYEASDVGYVDDRPVQNAMKRERWR